jgi:hypothetical protein
MSVANDTNDNEMVPGLCTNLLAFTLLLSTTPENVIRKPSMKAVQPVIASNRVPYLQMRLVGSHGISGREQVGK